MLNSIYKWWLKAIEPSPSTTDPEDRHKQRLLNMLLLVFAPVSIAFAVLDNLYEFSENGYLIQLDTLMVVTGVIVVLGIIYYFSRLGKFNIIIPILICVGFVIIYINAMITSAPHSEIVYLSLLIFLASDLFRPRITIIVSVLTIIVLTVFFIQISTMPVELYEDTRLYFAIITIFTFFVSYHRDQLEKDRQQLIQRERLRLQLLLENLPAYVWTTDEGGEVTSIGGTLSEHMENELRDFLKNDMASEYHRLASNHSRTSFEFEMEDHAFEGVIQAIQSPIDEYIDYIGVAVDVNDRVEREKLRAEQVRQQQQQQVLDEFLNSVSHDLRTPLSILRTSSYMLERIDDPVKRQTQIDKINRVTTRLETTIETMFKLVRLNMPLTVDRQLVPIKTVVTDAITMVQDDINQKSILVDTLFPDGDVMVEAIDAELREVFKQVIQNAIQYSQEDSLIYVRMSKQGKHAIVEVEDQGNGIPDDDLPKIFDPFYRGEIHRPMDSNSIGTGLTIAKRIIERHEGSIEAINQLGAGCIFKIKLPLAD